MTELSTSLQPNFRDAMALYAAGVHVITTDGEAGRYGITMTAVASVTDEPPTVMLCINRSARIYPILNTNRRLCINTLAAQQQDLAEHFAGLTKLSPEERFEYHIWQRVNNDQWQVEGAVAHLHGHVTQQHDVGTHTVFLVEIDEVAVNNQKDLPALVYFRRKFKSLS